MDQNNTNFVSDTTHKLLQLEKPIDSILTKDQYITVEYVLNNPQIRGILCYWDMGLGKTMIGAAIADGVKKANPYAKVVIFSPKTLAANFRNTIIRFLIENNKIPFSAAEEMVSRGYRFVSSNSSNAASNLEGEKQSALMKKLDRFAVQIRKQSLNDTLLIVDEAHNFFNSICNGSKNAVSIYDKIMNAKNIKIIFLSGTPIVNEAFELAPCYNMLKGYIYEGENKFTLFPEVSQDFNNFFVDDKNTTIKNRAKFMNRIVGLTSYYGEYYYDESKPREHFPEKLPLIVEKVEMSTKQFNSYITARVQEKNEETKKKRNVHQTRFAKKSNSSSTYRVKSRQISNFVLEDRKKSIDLLDAKEFKKEALNVNSPKMHKILSNIEAERNAGRTLGLVYSSFVSIEGIGIFTKILQNNGWKLFSLKEKKEKEIIKKIHEDVEIEDDEIVDGGAGHTFAIISGKVDPEERSLIVKTFNSKENIRGGIIDLILISGSGAEGLSLHGLRHIHIMEPTWNYSKLSQIQNRGYRFKSHDHLNENERNFKTFIYLSEYPSNVSKHQRKEEDTTDITMFKNLMSERKIINAFYKAMVEASVDCAVHTKSLPKHVKEKIKCLTCIPTNRKLYNPFIQADLIEDNPCHQGEQTEISAKEIEVGDKKVYYTYDKGVLKVFEYNNSIDGYTVVDVNDPIYAEIIVKLNS